MTVVATFAFSPDEARDDHGKWTDGGGDGGSPSTKAVKSLADGYSGTAVRGDVLGEQGVWHATPDGQRAGFVDAYDKQAERLGKDSPERRAISDYTGLGNRYINTALRSGSISRDDAVHIISLDSAFERGGSTLADDQALYRGLHDASFMDKWAPGTVATEDGFMSTGTDGEAARQFMGSPTSNAMLVINAPAGTPYLVGNPGEQEVILDRGTALRVSDIRDVAYQEPDPRAGSSATYKQVTADVIPGPSPPPIPPPGRSLLDRLLRR